MKSPRKWWRSVRRRRAGIYLVRTDKHLRPGRRENGYVGRSNNVRIRITQHLGHGSHKPKPWADLHPRWHVLRLPWWLSWRWIQAPLEAAAILLLAPRYNHSLNLANPRRVPLSVQARQRAERDRMPGFYHVKVAVARGARTLLLTLGWLAIVAGVGMTVWSNAR